MSTPAFTDVLTALEEIRSGRMIVIVDDEDRENEGDLMLAAEKVSPESINFMAKFGRGLICLTLTEERLEHLRIAPMSAENTSNYGTAFCEAIDAREGVTTGISAYDRARTILVAIDPATRPSDLSVGRSDAYGRAGSGRNYLRDHVRRRIYGSRARFDRVL